MSANLPWFRMYSRIVTDPEVELLSFEDQRHYVWLLCFKNDGYLDVDMPSSKLDVMVGRKLGLYGEAMASAKQRLVESKLIDECWQPRSWDELQFVSDSSKDRVRAYRERQKKKDHETIETNEKRDCNVTVTAQDTDTDTDTDTKKLLTSEPQAAADRNPAKMTTADHVMVINLYHQVLPELTSVLINRWHGSKHAKALQARWAESEQHRTPEFWEAFFQTVRLNDWWMGVRNGGGEPWTGCKLAWLVTRGNFDKVLEAGS